MTSKDDRPPAAEVIRDATEQKSVEQTLRESELKHRTLFETANDAILLMRHDRFIDCNARTLTMYGCSREQILGATPYEFSPPTQPDGQRSEEKIQKKIGLVLTKGPQVFEWECRRRDGISFMAGVSLNRLELDGETLLQAIVRDITKRKQAEMTLRANEEELSAIFEQAPMGIAIIDSVTGQFRKVNQEYCKIVGYPESRMLDLTFQDITHPDDLQKDLDSMQRLRKGNLHTFQMEKRYIHWDGSVVWVSLTCVPLWEGPGTNLQHIAMVEDITARKKSEERLAESEREYRELVECANSIILRWTRNGRINFLNEFGQRFFGYSAEEIIGRHVIGTIVPVTDSEGHDLRQLMDQVCADPIAFEQNINENMRRNGEHVWIAWTNRIVQDAQGQVAEILSVGTDITERKRMNEMLRESEAQLSLILNNVSDIIFAIAVKPNDDFRFTSVNHRFLEVTGLSESQIVGALVRDVIPKSAHDLVFGKYQEAIQSQLPAHWEEVTDYPTGRKVGHVTIVPVFDPHGTCTQLVGMIHDITEIKRAEEALHDSQEQLHQIVKCVPDLIWKMDLSGRFTYVNSAVEQIHGWTEEEFLKLTLRDVVTPEQAVMYLSKIEEELAKTTEPGYERNFIRTFESEIVRKDGSRFWGELRVALFWSEDGTPSGIIGTTRDITERKLAAEAIQELNTNLEKRVAERTAELAVARDRAEEADRFKSAFLATMSHELRTPLNSIIGFTGIILQGLAGPLNPEQHKQLEMVRDSAWHLLALINDVLDISKIEAGHVKPYCEPFDLRASIIKVVDIVKPLAEKKGLALWLELQPEIGEIVSDQRRLEQVMLNLLNNSIKFTERGSVTITAEIVPDTLPPLHSAFRFSVADTGIGIKSEDLSGLFQPFHQIDTGLSRQHEGTGLGLSICQRLVDLLGGEIHVTSEWHKGSTFTMILPMKESDKS